MQYLLPAVYIIRKTTDNIYMCVPESPRFEVAKKMYGRMKNDVIRIWNNYVFSIKEGRGGNGAIFIGHKGSGKTEAAYNIGNLAIDNGIPVIKIVNIKADMELIGFISTLGNCMLLFDEFGKNFSRDLQEKMLTLLSDKTLGVKLCIVTENEIHQLSSYIIGRPGRFLELLNYSRVDRSVIDEVCDEYNVRKKFYDELIACYNKAVVFSFDYLQAFVIQHLRYPEDTVEHMLTFLNVDLVTSDKYYFINSVTTIDNGEDGKPIVYDFGSEEISKDNFDNGVSSWVTTTLPTRVSFKFNKDNVVIVDDDKIELKTGEFKVILTKTKQERERPHADKSKLQQPSEMPFFD